jgi:transposase
LLASSRTKLNLSSPEKLKVYFQDEGRFGRMSNPASCWAPYPLRPQLPLQRVREYTYVYSAICPENGDVFSLILPYSDADAMQVFMTEFAEHLDGQPALLIMDQAPWHKSDKVKTPESILMAYQPPYSPELNPVEHFWEHLREKYISNRYWKSMDELEEALVAALQECIRQRENIKSLTLFDWMVYDR